MIHKVSSEKQRCHWPQHNNGDIQLMPKHEHSPGAALPNDNSPRWVPGRGSTELLGEANGQECGHGASLDGIQGLCLPSQQSTAKYGKE